MSASSERTPHLCHPVGTVPAVWRHAQAFSLWLLLSACSASAGASPIADGAGRFQYQHKDINQGRGIDVVSYRPAGFTTDSSIVFVIHGNSRNPGPYCEPWQAIAERERALVLCPDFARENGFPTTHEFNLGNLFETEDGKQGRRRDPADWSFTLIDAIFEYVVATEGSAARGYHLFGHSAGAQFVHRLLLFKPDARVLTAAAANAGWYTFPDRSVDYPYGIKGIGVDAAQLRTFYARDLVILAGEEDTDINSPNLRRTAGANRQGPHRFARARSFFEFARADAEAAGFSFNWRLETVPGVGHDNVGVAPAAARAFFAR